jgi:hypothetical protein
MPHYKLVQVIQPFNFKNMVSIDSKSFAAGDCDGKVYLIKLVNKRWRIVRIVGTVDSNIM